MCSSKGPCKVRNETETNGTKRNETNRNETKQIETKRNKSKRNETKRNETNQNETKQMIWQAIDDKNWYFLTWAIDFLILENYFLILQIHFLILECKIQKNWCTVTVAPTIEHYGGHSRTPANQRWDQVPGEESASPAWLAAPAMNACDTTKVYIWRLGTVCGLTLYRKCHSHNTPGNSFSYIKK